MARWKGLGVPFRFGNRGYPEPSADLRLLNDSIETILKTAIGERVYLPDFGSNLRRLLFGNMTRVNIARAGTEARRAIETWEPRVNIDDISITTDGSKVILAISWTPRVSNAQPQQTTAIFGV